MLEAAGRRSDAIDLLEQAARELPACPQLEVRAAELTQPTGHLRRALHATIVLTFDRSPAILNTTEGPLLRNESVRLIDEAHPTVARAAAEIDALRLVCGYRGSQFDNLSFALNSIAIRNFDWLLTTAHLVRDLSGADFDKVLQYQRSEALKSSSEASGWLSKSRKTFSFGPDYTGRAGRRRYAEDRLAKERQQTSDERSVRAIDALDWRPLCKTLKELDGILTGAIAATIEPIFA